MLASPPTDARADNATNGAIQLTQSPADAGATKAKGVTVEQRVKDLHVALKITADQEPLWNEITQDMRENAAAMDKLIAATRTTPAQTMTAVDDLKMYQEFAQEHIDGLKNLISSFEKLYAAMPRCPEEDRRRGVQDFRSQGRSVTWVAGPNDRVRRP